MIDNLLYGPLHGHSRYSDGFTSTQLLAQTAKNYNLAALGTTEHGTCASLIDHWEECNACGITPILGCEFYWRLPEAWKMDSSTSRSGRYHITFLSYSFEGYKRLIALNNAGHTQIEESRGKKYPIISLEMMQEYAGQGLIVCTGCIASATFHDYLPVAEEYVNTLVKIFGKDNVYAELMPHVITRREDGQEMNGYSRPLALSQRFGLKTVYTTDYHAGSSSHLNLLRKYTLAMKGFEFTASYIRSKDDDWKEAVACVGEAEALKAFKGVDEIIRKVKSNPVNFYRTSTLPSAEIEVAQMKVALLEALEKDIAATVGTLDYTGKAINEEALRAQFKQEWDLLEKYNFFSYFALLWDVLRVGFAHGVSTVARGSASGSYLLYLLQVTQLHPIVHGLMFERFLAELRLERNELPDVDIDIPESKRHILQEYAKEKWGFIPVGTILTHGHSSAIRTIERIYSKETGVDLPEKMVAEASDDDEQGEAFNKFMKVSPWFHEMYLALVNQIKGFGTHACAVVPVDEGMPVPFEHWGKAPAVMYSQSGSKNTLQSLGYDKYDLLASSNLDIIQQMEQRAGVKVPRTIEENDECFTVFKTNALTGLFQFDTWTAKNLIKLMNQNGININSIRVLSDITSLGRPGPLKQGYHQIYAEQSADISIHPSVIRSVFEQTKGVIIYQEQVAEVFARIAFKDYNKHAKEYGIVALKGLVPKNAKMAESEKFQKKYKELHDMFINGGVNYHGLDVFYLEELFKSLDGFIRYGFNLSHSLSYANISAQEAWFKHYYPEIFWATILESVSNNADEQDKLMRFVVDATLSSGVKFTTPHINNASSNYTLNESKTAIQCPISMIKGMGETLVSQIMENQPFIDLADVNNKTRLNKKMKLMMFAAGMLDGLGGTLYDLGVLEEKHFAVTDETKYAYCGVIEHIDIHAEEIVLTIDGEKYKILSKLSDEMIAQAKSRKVKTVTVDSPSVKHLLEGTTVLYNTIGCVIINFKRKSYKESLDVVPTIIEATKTLLGFVIPSELSGWMKFAAAHPDKVVGYVCKIEETTTKNGNKQVKLHLQDGNKVWACVEDNTKNGFLIKQSEIKSFSDIEHITVGDLIGVTLVMVKKEGVTTYNQIKNIKVLA